MLRDKAQPDTRLAALYAFLEKYELIPKLRRFVESKHGKGFEADADDALGETLYTTCSECSRGKFPWNGNPADWEQRLLLIKSWLFGTAWNRSKHGFRTRNRHAHKPVDSACDNGFASAPSAHLEHAELVAEVNTYLASRSELYRCLFLLGFEERLPYEHIAEILGIPLGTVKSRLHRLRTGLMDHLTERKLLSS